MRNFILISIFTIFISCKHSQEKKSVFKPEVTLSNYLKQHFLNGDFSGVVLIANNEEILYKKAIGFESYENQKEISLESKFVIGSVSKSFCAASIVSLIEKGKINLNDDINKYVSLFPEKQITIKQLLQHQSGVPYFDSNKSNNTLQELLENLKNKEFLFEPGEDDAYSNEGYSILAYIIEKVSGQSYNEFINDTFFKPLNMANSGILPYNKPEDLAVGHRVTPEKPIRATSENYNHLIGSGSNYSTIYDLLKWVKSINNNDIINLQKMDYPYGFGKRVYNNHEVVEQSGLVDGYTAYISIYPKENLYVLFLSNISSGFFNMAPEDISAILFDLPFSEPKVLDIKSIDSKNLQEYVGDYETDSGYPFGIELVDNGLFIKWNHTGDGVLLSPIEKDIFVNRSDFTTNSFHRDKDEKITGFTISIKNQNLSCKKVE